jgi:hypothetical protein
MTSREEMLDLVRRYWDTQRKPLGRLLDDLCSGYCYPECPRGYTDSIGIDQIDDDELANRLRVELAKSGSGDAGVAEVSALRQLEMAVRTSVPSTTENIGHLLAKLDGLRWPR